MTRDNRARIHTELGDMPPAEYEARFHTDHTATAQRFVTGPGNETPEVSAIARCEWCSTRLWPAGTGRPARFCGGRCRQAAHRSRLLAMECPEPGQRRALAEGWRPPVQPADIHTRQS